LLIEAAAVAVVVVAVVGVVEVVVFVGKALFLNLMSNIH
jgi:hypothetical protein